MTLAIGSLQLTGGIECYDWSELVASPRKRGVNRPIPGVTGASVRPRTLAEHRALVLVRIHGYLNADGSRYTGTDSHGNVLTLYGLLRQVADDTDTQVLELDGCVPALCIVEELSPPTFDSYNIARCVLDVTLPAGPLTIGEETSS
jgi:hypothetical protein